MNKEILIKEVSIDEIVKVNSAIPEFKEVYNEEYFINRYNGKKALLIVAYIDNQAAGYMLSYDRYEDGSFYCWMAGVKPDFRKNGILSNLMEYQFKRAKENGYSKIKIKTRNDKREMLSYLIKNGFYFTEVFPKEKIQENKILFEKDI